MSTKVNIGSLLPYGSISSIAKKLGLSTPSVSRALKKGNAGSAAVREALRMAAASGAIEAAQTLAALVA